jgi:tartrate dehydrogenase/decarboxylase/D-malate dehydrogenase
VLMLEHLGEDEPARLVMRSIERVTANPQLHTRDLGGNATTRQVTAAVCASIESEAGSLETDLHHPLQTMRSGGDK